jgi:hypothetical protein
VVRRARGFSDDRLRGVRRVMHGLMAARRRAGRLPTD